MNVPCPVPLLKPWSPAGYQVVEIADTRGAGPCLPASQREGHGKKPEAPRRPSSPVGYQVVQTADEKLRGPAPGRDKLPKSAPRATAARAGEDFGSLFVLGRRVRLTHSPNHNSSLVLWSSVAAALFVLVILTGALLARRSAVVDQRDHVVMARQPIQEAILPEAPQVVLPEEIANRQAAKAEAAPAEGHAPLAAVALANLPEVPAQGGFPDADVCDVGKAGEPRAGRETFGTAVQFVRNPQEAARIAKEERKLTFVLHVSGNFEDAAFT